MVRIRREIREYVLTPHSAEMQLRAVRYRPEPQVCAMPHSADSATKFLT
jgi:hypothetical protein